jgi:cob(I)alamin adenosyltransferase
MERGLIQVYTGEGKGKTTAATGQAVRALGHGLRVLLVRFLKPAEPPSGEILFLQGSRNLEVLSSGIGVIDGAFDPDAVRESVAATFAEARRRILAGTVDLAVLDEVNNAVRRGHLPLADLMALLEEKPAGVELVLTGRHADPAVLARADLVTRMEKVKHPLDAGIAARAGIEY